MHIQPRQYHHPVDFGPVSDFLIEQYLPGNRDGNWLQPAWEYMHCQPNLDESSLGKIGIWEHEGSIVAVVHYESRLGEAFFQIHPDYVGLKRSMLEYAEAHLYATDDSGKTFLRAYVNDFDGNFEEMVKARGYQNERRAARPLSMMEINPQISAGPMPEGYLLKSLAEDNDLEKIHRVLWKGFNHPGDPPSEGIEWRKKMQSGPNYRHDLTIVVESAQCEFVAFSGAWFVPANGTAYLEPVATDPAHRRKGLGRAAIREALRRCAELGATVAYVGSDHALYRSVGFQPRFAANCWVNDELGD